MSLADIKKLAGLIKEEESVNEAEKVEFLGYGAGLPLEKAVLDQKNIRSGELIKMGRDTNGKPYLVIRDPASAGDYMAYWNDKLGIWTIDFS